MKNWKKKKKNREGQKISRDKNITTEKKKKEKKRI